MELESESMEGPGLTREESQRYSRQLSIPEIGEAGQKRMKSAKVFMAGLGGLGSISAYYLAAAGIGYLKVVDMGEVKTENLNRQIIHWTRDVGSPKVGSAKKKLASLNPNVRLEMEQVKIDRNNVLDLVGDAELIVDASDNLETRKALNLASLQKKIPFIFGGVSFLGGMVTTFIPGETPCLECLFPGNDGEVRPLGVLGPVPGLVASVQVLEAIKVLLGLEGTLKGRLLSFQGKGMNFKEIKIQRNPDCPMCSPIMGQ